MINVQPRVELLPSLAENRVKLKLKSEKKFIKRISAFKYFREDTDADVEKMV